MKNLFTLIFILVTSITLTLGQGAESFNRFREKSADFYSGSFAGESGINWNFDFGKSNSLVSVEGIEKTGIVLKNDITAEVNSSVMSGGIGLLKIEYTTVANQPVKVDVYVNKNKVATLNAASTENAVTLLSENIAVNIDKPFYIRFKQADETSGQVIIDKVLWSKYASDEFGIVPVLPVPVKTKELVKDAESQIEFPNSIYRVFPNPARDYAVIEMSEYHNVLFKLFTLAGQMVLQEQVKGSGQKINLSNLKEGLYIYKILDDKSKLVTGKLIIR